MQKNDHSKTSIIDLISNDPIVLTGIITAILLAIGQWLLVLVYIWQLPPQVPLFYSLLIGSDQLADRNWLLVIPIISTLAILIWLLIIRLAPNLIPVFYQLLSWLTTLVVFIGAIALLHIIILVY